MTPCPECGGLEEHGEGCPELTKWDAAPVDEDEDESRFERENWEER